MSSQGVHLTFLPKFEIDFSLMFVEIFIDPFGKALFLTNAFAIEGASYDIFISFISFPFFPFSLSF